MRRIKEALFEDFIINKFNGYYLLLYGGDHYLLARLVFFIGRAVVSFMTFTHLIRPRICPSRFPERKTVVFAPAPVNTRMIQERAYFLWIDSGYQENTDIDNWLEAERQLCY